MSARAGVGIGRDSLRAVLVRRGAVVWSASAALGEDETLRDALVRLLSEMPRNGRTRLMAAIGPSGAQVKRLAGVPALTDRAALAQLVATNAGRFFLKNGIPLRVTDVHLAAADDVWAGAIEAPIVDEVAEACRDLGLHLDGALPTVAVLGYASAVTTGTVVWRDGDSCAEAIFENRILVRTRRIPAFAADEVVREPVPIHPALAPLGEVAGDFADAYGAAVSSKRGPFALRMDSSADGTGAARVRLAVLIALLLVSAAAALFGPGLAATHRASRMTARIARLQPLKHEIARTQLGVSQLSGALHQVGEFAARRRSMTRLLGAIAMATPESTAIVTLRVDSAGGSFVALATRGAAVLPSLGEVSEIDGASISGPVTREIVGTQELERVTIRFRLPPLRLPRRRQ